MLKTLRNPPAKSLISVIHSNNGYSSNSDRRERLLRIRAEQKQLYGPAIRGEIKSKDTPKYRNKELRVSTPELASEFYWLTQSNVDSKNVVIFKRHQTESVDDSAAVELESPPEKKS